MGMSMGRQSSKRIQQMTRNSFSKNPSLRRSGSGLSRKGSIRRPNLYDDDGAYDDEAGEECIAGSPIEERVMQQETPSIISATVPVGRHLSPHRNGT